MVLALALYSKANNARHSRNSRQRVAYQDSLQLIQGRTVHQFHLLAFSTEFVFPLSTLIAKPWPVIMLTRTQPAGQGPTSLAHACYEISCYAGPITVLIQIGTQSENILRGVYIYYSHTS